MENLSKFCTCKDTDCPLNPVNHNKGCTLCISKCLKAGEIPSCFFNAINESGEKTGYSYKDFADYVLKHT